MEVTRSANVLRRIAVGLRVIAWLVLVVFFASAVGLASKLAFISTAQTTVEQFLPFTAGTSGIFLLLSGVVGWLVLLAIAEGMMMLVGIEANTRAMLSGQAPVVEKETAGAR